MFILSLKITKRLLCPAVEQKVAEENTLRMRAESRVVEVEKQCSMLEFDLKQSVQKMEQLMKQKERLEEEVRVNPHTSARAGKLGSTRLQTAEGVLALQVRYLSSVLHTPR